MREGGADAPRRQQEWGREVEPWRRGWATAEDKAESKGSIAGREIEVPGVPFVSQPRA